MPNEELPVTGKPKEGIALKDRWALFISFLALLVSCLSWRDSHNSSIDTHKSVELADVTTPRKLKTANAFFTSGTSADRDGSLLITYQNIGKMPLTVGKTTVSFVTDKAPRTSSNEGCYSDLQDKKFELDQTPARETEPDGFGSALVQFNWPKSCAEWIPDLLIDITYTCTDALKKDFSRDDAGVPLINANNGIAME